MMCYKDKTFCSGAGCLDFDNCDRALTKEVRDRAEAFGLPISEFADPTKNECYKPPVERKQ
jgi:hypothetical protein